MVETSAPGLTMDSESSGAYARHRLEQLCERLRRLRPEVLDDRDPEPLHQYRVSLRRLRSLLIQFAPALLLPAKVTPSRIALLARATGATRDLDVLGLRLQHDLLPALPKAWPNGSVRGLKARGGLTLDLTWKDGALTEAVFHPTVTGPVQVRLGTATATVQATAGTLLRLDAQLRP